MKPVTGLMSNKNLFAEYLALLLPLLIYAIGQLKSYWKTLSIVSVFCSAAFILALMARSAWLALALSAAAISFVSFAFKRRGAIEDNETSFLNKYGFQLSILVVVVLFVADLLTGMVFSSRLMSIFQSSVGSAGVRVKIWTHTLEMIKDSPLSGLGAGSWKIAFQKFGSSGPSHVFRAVPLNDYLGVFAETGLFGFIGYLGSLLVGLSLFVRKLRKKASPDKMFARALMASLVVFMVISFFNFPKDRIEHMLFLLFVLAWVEKGSSFRLPLPKVVGKIVLVALFPFLCAALYIGVQRYTSEKAVRSALEARTEQNWNAVIKHLESVNFSLYPIEPSTTPVVWYRGLAHFQLNQQEDALKDFKQAYKVNPYHLHVLNNLATSFELKKRHGKAIDLYKEALIVNP
ncbi:MAG: O-antigen ligase family protein [Flavobacteriales bacterium]|nr:O-antigen ligase family protein [Flavobacteriales bacterium]